MAHELDDIFLKPYDAASEDEAYSAWEHSGYFDPDFCVEKGVTDKDAEPYTIVLPPPNVTGSLHMGHAAMLAIEDIMIRYARLQGKRALWLPGTDHAAIATQSKVEGIIYKEEGLRRHDLGRDELLRRIDEYAKNSHDTIVGQVRKMGASIDWTREAFTFDEPRNRAVRTAFKKMYDDGIIYRGHRIVNWDPKGQTTISDDEVVYQEEKTTLYYFKYGPFEIATARPETKFGDKYVVMHPDDARYKQYQHGQTIDLEWINGPITATIIKDEAIDMEFGTGVMTITPWHSTIDFEIAERHKLDKEQIIDQYGKLLDIAGEFAGQKITAARPLIVEKLRAKGLVTKEQSYVHQIGTAERTGGIIEPQIMNQWFVAVNKPFTTKGGRQSTLKEEMLQAVRGGDIEIVPTRFEKTYFNWIENLHDWCISRQIWYGHRVPVWYRNGEEFCGVVAPEGDGWAQDEDTLDTWFSSGLWTFSTLGWPDDTPDLKTYHPTAVLETGYDILFFWIARMIMMSTYLLGEVPFKTAYLHGLVRDGQGRKISKSLGNNIDPVELVNKYGADAVRLALIIGTAPGNDMKMSEEKVRGYRLFSNKLWNIARFILTRTSEIDYDPSFSDWSGADLELIAERQKLLSEITAEMDQFKYYLVGEKLYHYAWHRLADEILEESRAVLEAGGAEAVSRQQFLLSTYEMLLRTLHPFMPFVTEKIWSHWPHPDKAEFLMIERWPLAKM